MAMIVPFRRAAETPRRPVSGVCEVVIFPGVRIERRGGSPDGHDGAGDGLGDGRDGGNDRAAGTPGR